MTSDKDIVEMTVGNGGRYEAHLDVDDKTSFVIKDITNVRFFDPIKQEWIDIGYKEPIDFYGEIEGLQKQQLRDNQKRAYCLSHNIPLYEISYKDNIISKLEECIYGNNETN